MEKREKLKKVVDKYFQDLSKMEKPNTSKIGGTYYGSTELISSVGNHLEIVEGRHITYCYGSNIQYKDVYAIRIGGAYKFSPSVITEELKAILGTDITDWRIISDIGTNYSTIGFGKIDR